MSFLEQFAINIILGIVQSTVKNPTHKAAVQAQLLGVADDIYLAYGFTPPTRTVVSAVLPGKL
jgi:hypothetical protein